MGANAITTIAIGLLVMTCSFYLSVEDVSYTISKVLKAVGVSEDYVQSILKATWLPDVTKVKTETESDVTKVKTETEIDVNEVKTDTKTEKQLNMKLFTPDELLKFDGSPSSKGLYLAILGEVFNVEKGAQHYKPGGGYAFFTGKDATRAYISGDFSEKGLVDDVSGLDDASLKGIEDWLGFYRGEYEAVGKVIGRYYDEIGNPTNELASVKAKIGQSQKNKWVEDKEKEQFPPCNSEWSKEKGSKVWCTNKSGGIDRDWIGVPRMLHKKGKDPRCVCVKDNGPSSANPDELEHSDRGDLDHPDLKQYPDCAPTAQSCPVKEGP